MAMQFEYDEKGGTFYYFLLSFMALVLVPVTYYFWPRSDKKERDEDNRRICNCDPCETKRHRLKKQRPFRKLWRTLRKVVILLAWIVLFLVAYKTSQVELEWKEFDPYHELGIDREASSKEIKKAYRSLSLIYHPDKETGDSQKFMKISKAYQALTDEEAMENWKTHGNPDGPGAIHFGIALPKWIVEKQNSVWVLGVYIILFMIILPITVGTWWYRSIQFSSEQILMDTARLYNMFLQKTPNMILRRVIMIVGASFEFDKRHNNEIVLRPSDNEDLPRVMKYLPHLGEKNKERPLCFTYSVKARALIHSHLSRLDSLSLSLQQDRDYVVKRCPYLLNEMISIAAQHVALSHAGRARMPKLSTIENMMKISQMMVQALWEHSNPLLQLPHITDDILKHFVTKKRNIRRIEQFVLLKEDERRMLLRTLTDAEYEDIINVCSNMPYVVMEAHTEVKDDEDNNIITAGSIVTVTVNLTRQPMGDLLNTESNDAKPVEDEPEQDEETEEGKDDTVQRKPKVWEKQKKKKGKKNKKNNKGQKKPVVTPGAAPVNEAAEEISEQGTPKKTKQSQDDSDEGSGGDDEEEEDKDDKDKDDKDDKDDSEGDNNGDDKAPNGEVQDEEFWEEMQKDLRKENKLETKSKETHLVHCPYFPAVKYEWYWLYLADRKTLSLMSAPIHVCSLKDHEELQLKFSAPMRPGHYTYAVILKSDSYLDFDVQKIIKLDVREAKKVEPQKQWDFSDDEEDKADDDESDSSDYTDSEDDV